MKPLLHLPKLAVTVTALAAQACCMQAWAQTTPPPAQQLERVEVTGSNIKRTAKEGSSPIDVITAKEIAASGARTVLDLMKKLSPAIGNDGFNDTPNQNGFSRAVSTVGLRNLSATSTLVLLNGRRMTPSAYANPNNGTSTLYDLNSIPVSAIARVEVLKDGASAVYGSDAVGGVINFITRSDYQGAEIKVNAGANGHRDYQRGGISGTVGFGDLAANGYNVFVGADFSLKGRSMQNDSTDLGVAAADYRALNLRRNPYGSFVSASPFFTKESAPNSRSFPQGSSANVINQVNCPTDQQFKVTEATRYGFSTAASAAGLLNRTFCNYNLEQFNEMQNPGNDASILSRGTLKVTENITGFAELAYSRSERNYLGAPRTISGLGPTTNFLNGGLATPFQAILEVGHPDNPFPTARAAVQLRFENTKGGFIDINQGYRALAGAKGTAFGDWDWESAFLFNRSHRDETYLGFLRVPVLAQMRGPAFGGTNRSLASIAADPDLSRPLLNKGTADVYQWDAKVSTEFSRLQLPGGPVAMAAGIELRRESIDISPDPENAAGNILGLANTAVKGARNVQSGFFEFRLPVLKSLDVDLAGRVDKYPGIKANFVPKIGFKWTANDIVTFRGTYAEGFRAPAVSQVSPGGAQFFVNGLADPIRCNVEAVPPVPFPGGEAADCSKSVSGVGGANPALQPEKSRSSSFGMILSPVKGLDVLVGYFKIRKNGEVALGSAQDVIDHPDRYPPTALTRDTNPALLLNGKPGTGPLLSVSLPWTNQGSTMVSGVDAEVRTVAKVMDGQATWTNSVNGTYNLNYERIEQPGFVKNNLVGTRGGLYDFATSAPDTPRAKFRFTSSLETGAHSMSGSVNYVSSISFIRQMDGSTTPPKYYSGSTCHYGGTNFDNVGSRNIIGVAATATNERDLYINRYPGCSLASWMTFDVGYVYTGIKNLTLGLNIQNLLNEKAPYDPGASYLGYNTGLHNGLGRFFSVSAGYKFR